MSMFPSVPVRKKRDTLAVRRERWGAPVQEDFPHTPEFVSRAIEPGKLSPALAADAGTPHDRPGRRSRNRREPTVGDDALNQRKRISHRLEVAGIESLSEQSLLAREQQVPRRHVNRSRVRVEQTTRWSAVVELGQIHTSGF
jgi:hypothetical protein